MKVAQAYQQNSQSNVSSEGLGFSLATDLNRPGVFLSATVNDSISFARSMLTLHKVVNSNMITPKKDYSKYQTWVQGEYLKELGKEIKKRDLQGLIRKEAYLQKQIASYKRDLARLLKESKNLNVDFYQSQDKFWSWLYAQDYQAWVVLDPVISVQEDGVIFEAFSMDESTYGRVTLPKEELILNEEMQRGTTNIDFSKSLAEEFDRVRSYRPLELNVGYKEANFSTNISSTIEKKIDLPESWINGFLEVQSASSMNKTSVHFSPSTISDLISVIERKKDNVSPKSIKFILEPEKKPIIDVEPWGIKIREYQHVFKGNQAKEIRIWGRKRLKILKELLPQATEFRVDLLGTGLPSFWCIRTNNINLDLGLSGWSANDWSSQAKFSLLSNVHHVSEADIQKVSNALFQSRGLVVKDIADKTKLDSLNVTHALTKLCSRGQVMYDFHKDIYRWRELFPLDMVSKEKIEPKIFKDALKIIQSGQLKITNKLNELFGKKYIAEFTKESAQFKQEKVDKDKSNVISIGAVKAEEHVNTATDFLQNWAGQSENTKKHTLEITMDSNNDVHSMNCSCIEYQKTHLKKGPCVHIIALLKEIYRQEFKNSEEENGNR